MAFAALHYLDDLLWWCRRRRSIPVPNTAIPIEIPRWICRVWVPTRRFWDSSHVAPPVSVGSPTGVDDRDNDPDRQPQPAGQDCQNQVQGVIGPAVVDHHMWSLRSELLIDNNRLLSHWRLLLLAALHWGAVIGPLHAIEVPHTRHAAVTEPGVVVWIGIPARGHGRRRRWDGCRRVWSR